MRKRRLFGALIFAIPAVLAVATLAVAGDGGKRNVQARTDQRLSGGPEHSARSRRPAMAASTAQLDGEVIHYTLTFGGARGSCHSGAHPLRAA